MSLPHTPSPSPTADANAATPAEVSRVLAHGVALHQAGDLDGAAAAYTAVLQAQPGQFDATHLLGVLAQQRGDTAQAVALITQALQVQPQSAAAHCNLGIALRAAGQGQAALRSLDTALALQPNYSQALLSRANTWQDLGNLEAALQDRMAAARLQPASAAALFDWAQVLQAQGQWALAAQAYRCLMALPHEAVLACNNLGTVLQATGQLEDALLHYDAALRERPDFSEAHHNRGTVLQALGQLEPALAAYEQALRYMPQRVASLNNRGLVLQALGQPDAALQSYAHAIAAQPDDVAAHNNRGLLLHQLGRLPEALASFDEALRLQPGYAQGHSNRGVVLQDLKRAPEALASYERALALEPHDIETQWNQALTLLMMGDYAQGWPLYETRWQRRSFTSPRRHFTQPLWLGDAPIAGKTILLHAEQGLGDTLQFCRFASQVKALGARVVLEVPQVLCGLLSRLQGVDAVVASGEPLPAFDVHCPLMSLPFALKTQLDTVPHPGGYLTPHPHALAPWASRLASVQRPRVGLVWRGSAQHRHDGLRSLPLQQLLDCLPEGPHYVSLQQALSDTETACLQASGVQAWGHALHTFEDTAALCAQLDGVVSVDTSVVHLAGALGVRTWLLLAEVSDWRWLLNREDSPWYSSMQLLRCPPGRGWTPVLQQLAATLRAL